MNDIVQTAPPNIPDEAISTFAERTWGVTGRLRSLGSHQDRNFLIDDGARRLLLKVANPSVTAVELEAQSRAAAAIADETTARAPRALTFDDGSTVRALQVDGVTMHTRLLEFLDGDTLSGGRHLAPAAVRAMGALAATVDTALSRLDLAGAERDHQWDLRHTPLVLDELLPHVGDLVLRARLAEAARDAWAVVGAHADDLPQQFIHGDLTDDNVVSRDGRLPDGVIDLGDLNHTWTVGELAITVSSLLHHDGVDLPAVLPAITAYHGIRPLSSPESEALWPLVVARAAVLVASAHHVLAGDPANDYAAENLQHERAIFDAAVSVPLEVATALVRAAIGDPREPAPLPVGGRLLEGVDAAEIADFSPASPALDSGRWLDPDAEDVVFADALADATIAIGRFGESRLTRSTPFDQAEPAAVSLGVEVALRRRVAVLAPWAGVIEAAPTGTIVLRAGEIALRIDGVLDPLLTGSTVSEGEVIAAADGRIWVRAWRGDQVVPRFVPRSLALAWRSIALNPTALMTAAHEDATDDGPAAETGSSALLARRAATLAEVQEHYFPDPPVMVRGWRELLIDADARVYLDTLNNVTSVGHAHPRLIDAIRRQWSLLNTNSRFHYPAVVEFAERLAELLPAPLDTVFLVNSGSEAVDLALRLSQLWTGRLDLLALREAYHGWTYLSDAVSTSIADNPAALETRPAWVHTLPPPLARHGAAASERFGADAAAEVDRLAAAGKPVAGFIAEPVFGNAGGAALPDGYLAQVYAAVRRHGGLAIADEVQVGYGRLGEWFWGFEQQGVVPDIVTVAKAAGGGHPLGAVITTKAIAERYRDAGYFFSSAGGSPVSSVVGLTVLDIIRDDRLQANARETGRYLKERLEDLGQRHPILAKVHGSGFYLGPEFILDRASWTPATAETAAICERLRRLGVIAQPTGDHQNILKIKPPMCFSRDSADAFVSALDRALTTGW